MKTEDLVQGSAKWKEFRIQGIGASECAAVMGLSPYMTRHDVWMEKTGRRQGFEGNSATERGQALEAKARSLYELENLETMTPAIAVHPAWPFLRASLDGVSEDKSTVLEIKIPGKETVAMAKRGEVPEHYQLQCQMQLLVTGAEQVHFFVYSHEDDSSALVVIKPDLPIQVRIVEELTLFWTENILKDVAPPLTDRDVKDFDGDREMETLVENFLSMKDKLDKKDLDEAKALLMKAASHPKMKCGRLKLTAVSRNGKFSYHKLTLADDELDKTGT